MRPRTAAAVLLVLSACPKEVPPPALAPAPAAPPVLVPLTAAQRLEKRVAAVASEALALEKEQDELLWAHWTLGAPLELERSASRHAVLFDDATWADVEAARAQGVGNALGVQRLERWIAGVRMARATEASNAALTELESRISFKLGDKEVRWRDVGRLLANEKSAVKRKALWAASREVLGQLGEAYRLRDEAAGDTGPLDEAAVAAATALLDDTELEWKQLLETLAKSELGLPVDKLGREDLPRLLRPSAVADAAFPRQEQAAKATALLSALGLYALPGLTLDLTESSKKNPVPLTLAVGGPADVRVCFRPAGGARDLAALYAELGRALAIHEANDAPATLPSLADFPEAEAAAQLFGQILEAPAAHKALGVADGDATFATRSLRALRLYSVRKSAAAVLTRAGARGQSDEVAAAAWKTWSTRALGVPVAPEDSSRWRLETDPFGRSSGVVQAFVLAARWRKLLPDDAWTQPATAALLKAAWAEARQARGVSAGATAERRPPDAGIVLERHAPDASTALERRGPDAGTTTERPLFDAGVRERSDPDAGASPRRLASDAGPSPERPSPDAGPRVERAELGTAR